MYQGNDSVYVGKFQKLREHLHKDKQQACNIIKAVHKTVLLIFLGLMNTQVMALTVGELVTGIQYLDCENTDPVTTITCQKIMSTIQTEMQRIDLTVNNGDIVFEKNPIITPGSIDTGHSCSHRAWLRDNFTKATISADAEISLRGDSLSTPMALHLLMPIDFYARADLKESWGFRTFWGSCVTFASDTYYGDMRDSMEMDTVIFLSLEPQMEINELGEMVITISPLVNVQFALESELNFDMHGKNPFNGMLTGITAGLSTLMQGEGLKQLLIDIGIGIGQTLQTVDSGLFKDFLFDLVADLAAKKIDGYAPEIQNLLQEKITAEVARGLDLDENGQRVFIISNEYTQNLQQFINNFDVEYYLRKNPEMASIIGSDPLDTALYWIQTGLKQGQAGSPEFDAKKYLQQYADLEAAYGDDYEAAFNHWLSYGIDEGRQAQADPETSESVPSESELSKSEVQSTVKSGNIIGTFSLQVLLSVFGLLSIVRLHKGR